jgi:hypothetical protein
VTGGREGNGGKALAARVAPEAVAALPDGRAVQDKPWRRSSPASARKP